MTFAYSYSAEIWLPVFTVFLLIALSAYSWRGRSVPGALPFAFACLSTALWALALIMEHATMDPGAKITWIKFGAAWQLLANTLITCFIFEFAWPQRWQNRRNLILLSIVPVLNIAAIFIDARYPLQASGLAVDGLVLSQYEQRSWLFLAYIYALGVVNVTVFAWLFMHSPRQRWPVVVMTTGQISTGIIFLLAEAGIRYSLFPLELFAIAVLFFVYAVVRFGLYILNPIPFAHQMALKQMHTGMLVLDSHKRVVSLNASAEQMLKASAGRAMRRPVWDLLPDYPDDLQVDAAGTEIELSLGIEQDIRHYTLTISLLKDWWGFDIGRLLLLRDVTEQKQAQANLIAQKQALAMLQERERLARDLHDTIGQVLGYANMQIEAAAKLSRDGRCETASQQLDRLGSMVREAHAEMREYIMNLRTTPALHRPFFTAVQQYLEGFTHNYDIQTNLAVDAAWNDTTFSPDMQMQIFRIVQEALTNARKHSKACYIQVRFETKDGHVFVIIQDDGNGFALNNLEMGYGQHFGLQFMQERASQLGGILQILSTPGKGTEVVLELPANGTDMMLEMPEKEQEICAF